MFCTNCGKAIEPDTHFCPACGANQVTDPAQTPPSPPSNPQVHVPPPAAMTAAMPPPVYVTAAPARNGVHPMVWVGLAVFVLAMFGGLGYWAMTSKMADTETLQRQAMDQAARQAHDEEQRRLAAEKAAEAAEIKAAYSRFEQRLATEEAEAKTRRN